MSTEPRQWSVRGHGRDEGAAAGPIVTQEILQRALLEADTGGMTAEDVAWALGVDIGDARRIARAAIARGAAFLAGNRVFSTEPFV